MSPAAEVIQTLGRRVTVAKDTLVLTEPDDNRVVLYDVSGTAPRKIGAFGTVGTGAGDLHGPHGATLDPETGHLYVSDTFNHRVQVFDVAGLAEGRLPRLVRLFGNFGPALGDLKAPSAPVAFSTLPALRGRVFVVDSRNDRIQVFDRGGTATGTVLGGKGAEPGKLDGPIAAAFDPRGRVLYVAESVNPRISAFDASTGAFLFTFGGGPGGLSAIGGIAVDAAGVVHATDVGKRSVRRFAPVRGAGGLVRSMKPQGSWALPAAWRYPQSIAVDARGRVYVSDLADDRGEVFSPAGLPQGGFGQDVAMAALAGAAGTPASSLPASFCSNGGAFRVDLARAPSPVPVGTFFELEVRLVDGCRGTRPIAGEVLLHADGAMPGHGHGMASAARTASLGDGRYLVSGLRFHMPGEWEVRFDLVRGKSLERAQAAVTVE